MNEEEVEPPLGVLLARKRGKTKSAKRASQATPHNTEPLQIEAEPVPIDAEPVPIEPENSRNGARVSVSMFDDSVENHFRVMHTISELCGDAEDEPLPASDIRRLSSSTTFLREWADFKYEPRDVRFACEAESSDGEDVVSRINLRQFSSATVPQNEAGDTSSPELSHDYVMYVGGPVWALDWCPRVHESHDHHAKCEFIAIAAHPPGSSYHKLGEPLTGRGAIQIWCLLNASTNDEGVPIGDKPKGGNKRSGATEKCTEQKRGRPRKKPLEESVGKEATEEKLSEPKRPRGRPRKKPIEESIDKEAKEEKSTQPKRPRGRPRNKSIEESVDNLDGRTNCDEVLAIDYPKESSELHSMDCLPANTQGNFVQEDHDKKQLSYGLTQPKKPRGRPRKKPIKEPVDNLDGGSNNNFEVLAIEYQKESLELHSTDCLLANTQVDAVQEETSYKQTRSKRPRGIHRKKPIEESVENLDESSNTGEALDDQYPKELLELEGMDCAPESTQGDEVQDDSGKKRKTYRKTRAKIPREKPGEKPVEYSVDNLHGSSHYAEALGVQYLKETLELHAMDCVPAFTQAHDVQEALNEKLESPGPGPQTNNNVSNNGYTEIGSIRCSVPKDVALPRIIFCLAHHGKVAWDVKWRPLNEHDSRCKHRMGYLAVLLGNGSLEVWEVPVPRAIEVIYSSSSGEGTDPRFVKLAPVFRCSMLKSGDKKSIPLTVEWSASPPHDYLIAGCHDGTVAMWKFSASNVSQDTRPLLCFSADTNPIRALSWAPVQSNSDNANVIATAGHGGLKFWDLRDPFRPLWDIDHIPRFIYSLDWIPDPRCVLLSFDDGTMRLLSLTKAASDAPVTGKPFAGTKQQGLHNLGCLPFAIWSVQVSRLTGMVAYCGADGTVLRFQLTSNAVEKDATRNRAPHFLCVSLTEEDSVVTINTPVPHNPFPLKTSRKAEPNKVKREHDKMTSTSQDQVLALCYGDDPGIEVESGKEAASLRSKTRKSGDDQALVCMDQEPFNTQDEEIGEKGTSLKSIVKQKSKSSKKNTEDEQELEGRDEELINTQREKTGTEYEVFPSKQVAMHRVRWNMNKGSERWLCYGGAAGIVRCQEIVLSDIDMKWARKK
ncbi:hypothetical protein ABKV19_020943 [Rosa sericea]